MKKIALNVVACSMLTFLALGALSPSATPEVYTVELPSELPSPREQMLRAQRDSREQLEMLVGREGAARIEAEAKRVLDRIRNSEPAPEGEVQSE
jgi:hypothetical protein